MIILSNILKYLQIRRKIRTAQFVLNLNKIQVFEKLNEVDADVITDIFVNRIYAPLFPFYQKSIIVDIGAHKGFFSIFASKFSAMGSKIFAVEPDSTNYNNVIQNLKLNKMENVSASEIAISGQSGIREFYLSESVNHSLLKLSDSHPYVHQKKSLKVNTLSLSDFMKENKIEKIDFLKIDCEGGEYEILYNTSDSTFAQIRTIALEFHDLNDPTNNIYNLVNYLTSKNYRIITFNFQETVTPLNLGILIVSK